MQVYGALAKAGLQLGSRAAEPMPMEAYPFQHDVKDYKVFWDVRKVIIASSSCSMW